MIKTFTGKVKFGFLCLSLIFSFTACRKKNVTPEPVPPDPVVTKKWVVSTVAGSSTSGFKDGDTTQVQFNNAQGIVADNNGNLFVGDIANASIRQVTYLGHVTTYAGKNIGNPDPLFGNIYSLVRDSHGNLFSIEYDLIRKITSPSNSAVFAGSLSTGFKDGVGTEARFYLLGCMTIDGQDNIFLPDYDTEDNFQLRKITANGVVSTLTLNDHTDYPSNGSPNYHYLYSIAIDGAGNKYVTGNGNCLIKKIDPAGNVTVFAGDGGIGFVDGKGTAARFNTILGMTCDATGNIWVSDGSNHAIRKVTPDGVVSTIAGDGAMGYMDGAGAVARFKYPFGITVDNKGVVFVMDNGNNRVRKLEYK